MQKKLILISGSPCVGKTAVATRLFESFDNSAYLDGDWCWCVHPFSVTDKRLRNGDRSMSFVLSNYLDSDFDYVFFTSVVLTDPGIREGILDGITAEGYETIGFTLTCSEETLKKRHDKRGDRGETNYYWLRLPPYPGDIVIDTENKSIREVVREMKERIESRNSLVEFRTLADFPRGTLYDLLADAYSYDPRNRQIWDADWKESDDFFYDHPEIAGKYSLVTCLDGKPVGFVTWDPRHRPEYVEIGHNGIREQYKGRGYGKLQLEEAIRRIKTYEGLKRIIVGTNSNLIAPKNYESVGFVLYDRKPNETESAYTGDYLRYEMIL